MTTAEIIRMTEEEARKWVEDIRWPDGPFCPRCGSYTDAYRLGGKSTKKGLCKCRSCRKTFTVRIGTIFEESPLPLRDWIYAITRMCASKKGISAHQLHRELGVTYKTAWFLCHRIRHAMAPDGSLKLSGEVEADEAYVGGKPRYKGTSKKGRGTSKTPVAVLVERNGKAKTKVVNDVTARTLMDNLRNHVEVSSTLYTDDWKAYNPAGDFFAGGHHVVDHSHGEYVRGNVYTNTAESFICLLKRGIYGSFHHCSSFHLHRYCNEFSFRWNWRDTDDVTRAIALLRQIGNKRLTYKKPDSRCIGRKTAVTP